MNEDVDDLSKGSSKSSKRSPNLDRQFMDLAAESNEKMDKMIQMLDTIERNKLQHREAKEKNKLQHREEKEKNKLKTKLKETIDALKCKKLDFEMNFDDSTKRQKTLDQLDVMIFSKESELEDLENSDLDRTPKSSGKRRRHSCDDDD